PVPPPLPYTTLFRSRVRGATRQDRCRMAPLIRRCAPPSPRGAGRRQVGLVSFAARTASKPAMRQRLDPRLWQIGALTALLLYGVFVLRFEVTLLRAALIVLAAVATQRFFSKDLRSALISGLSLALLLRSNHVWILLLAAAIAIASKFVLRIKGKHLFNPTNFAIVVLLAATNDAWVSPGQWGSA